MKTTIATLAIALTACNPFQPKEEKCLDTVRNEFLDPDSARIVKNSGSLGETGAEVSFFVTVVSTNAAGGPARLTLVCRRKKDSEGVSSGDWYGTLIEEIK